MQNSERESQLVRCLVRDATPRRMERRKAAETGLGGLLLFFSFLHSHFFPWRCVTGTPWSFVSLGCYVSHVGRADRQRTEDGPVELKEPLCLEVCPTGPSTAAHSTRDTAQTIQPGWEITTGPPSQGKKLARSHSDIPDLRN